MCVFFFEQFMFVPQGHIGDNPFENAVGWTKNHFSAAATAAAAASPWPPTIRHTRYCVSSKYKPETSSKTLVLGYFAIETPTDAQHLRIAIIVVLTLRR